MTEAFQLPRYIPSDDYNLDRLINEHANLASQFHERIVEKIREFDAQLDPEHEVGMRLVSFGQTYVFHVSDIDYYDPSLIIFSGYQEDNSPIQLIQHVSQINFLLMAVRRLNPEEPEKLIGFLNQSGHEDAKDHQIQPSASNEDISDPE